MNLSIKLLSAVAATTLGAAALTLTTTTPAEAYQVDIGASCQAAGGSSLYMDGDSWECTVVESLAGTAEPALRDLCLDPTNPNSFEYEFSWTPGLPGYLAYVCDYGN